MKQVKIIEKLIMNEVNIREIKLEKKVNKWNDAEVKTKYEKRRKTINK